MTHFLAFSIFYKIERVYVTNLEDENVTAFIDELCRRLSAAARGLPGSRSALDLTQADAGAAAVMAAGPLGDDMPFELRALEVALDVVSRFLERMASELEAAAHPALDALTHQVSTPNLERVRRIKSRLVRLATRVETLKEVRLCFFLSFFHCLMWFVAFFGDYGGDCCSLFVCWPRAG
jgi:magnesium transporter